MTMKYYVHDVPGRLRVKIPTIKGNAAEAEGIRDIVESMRGVKEVSINSVTGSVVVYYNPKSNDSRTILSRLKEHSYFDDSMVITNDAYIRDAATKAGESLRRAAMGWAVGKALEGSGLSFLTVLI